METKLLLLDNSVLCNWQLSVNNLTTTDGEKLSNHVNMESSLKNLLMTKSMMKMNFNWIRLRLLRLLLSSSCDCRSSLAFSPLSRLPFPRRGTDSPCRRQVLGLAPPWTKPPFGSFAGIDFWGGRAMWKHASLPRARIRPRRGRANSSSSSRTWSGD